MCLDYSITIWLACTFSHGIYIRFPEYVTPPQSMHNPVHAPWPSSFVPKWLGLCQTRTPGWVGYVPYPYSYRTVAYPEFRLCCRTLTEFPSHLLSCCKASGTHQDNTLCCSQLEKCRKSGVFGV